MNKMCLSTMLCVAIAVLPGTLAAQAANPKGADARGDIFAVLPARGPHPSLGHHADLFGRFVGTWDADYSFIAEDGSVRHKRGEVLFGWVLDGHALQDIFLSYPESGSDERKMVTGLRWVDPRTGRCAVEGHLRIVAPYRVGDPREHDGSR